MLRPSAGDSRVGFETIGKHHLDSFGAEHDVEVSQNNARIDDDNPRAHTILDVFAPACVRFQTAHANYGRSNDLVRLGRRRWQRMGLQRVKHRVPDIFLGELAWCGLHRPMREQEK